MSITKGNKEFYVIGLNYKKADVVTRSNFSLSKEKQQLLLKEATDHGINSVIILSTCNRIEITGFAEHPFQLISLLCKYSNGTVDEFAKVSYVYRNREAAEHIIKIATGIESQILGDYEIVGQLKDAFQQSRDAGKVNAYIERLFNVALQASKEVKNKTSLSSGTTTVSYAAIQYIKDNYKDLDHKNILVYGLGDIGDKTAKSCSSYLNKCNVTVINRTDSKSFKLANEIKVNAEIYDNLNSAIQKSDFIIVATGASQPVIKYDHFKNDKEQLIIDLSIPRNVESKVSQLKNKEIIDVDVLSAKTKRTLDNRKKQIPLAQEIIQKYKLEFFEWLHFRKSTPAINSLKTSLETIQQEAIQNHSKKYNDLNSDFIEDVTNQIVNKIVSKFAIHLKSDNSEASESIKVMKQVFNVEVTTKNTYD